MKKLPLVEAADAMAMAVVLETEFAVAESYTDMDLHFFVGPTVIGGASSKLDQSWHVDLPEADEQ